MSQTVDQITLNTIFLSEYQICFPFSSILTVYFANTAGLDETDLAKNKQINKQTKTATTGTNFCTANFSRYMYPAVDEKTLKIQHG